MSKRAAAAGGSQVVTFKSGAKAAPGREGAAHRPTGGSPRTRTPRAAGHGAQRGRAHRPWWRGPAPLIGALALVAGAIAAFFVVANVSGPGNDVRLGAPASAAILRAVEDADPAIAATVGTSNLPNPLSVIPGGDPATQGKPQVLYIGADFCPVCAAQRWSLINALGRFGTFSGVRYMRSAATDGDLATFSFHGSGYSSPYLTFVAIENEDRAGKELQPLTPEQQRLFATLGGNGYPLLDIAGRYVNRTATTSAAGFTPAVLDGKDWGQIAAALQDTRSPITQGIVGSANYLTAAFCTVTHDRPANVCTTPTIRQIEARLRS